MRTSFFNVGLYEYGNVKRHHFPTVQEDATCTLQVKYGEMSPQKRFVCRATPTRYETAMSSIRVLEKPLRLAKLNSSLGGLCTEQSAQMLGTRA